MEYIKNFENYSRKIRNFKKGDKVMINPNIDNDSYDDFRENTLIITDVATNKNEHPGYDDSVGDALYDLVTIHGDEVPFPLYDYELLPIE